MNTFHAACHQKKFLIWIELFASRGVTIRWEGGDYCTIVKIK